MALEKYFIKEVYFDGPSHYIQDKIRSPCRYAYIENNS